ncbi:disease resistance protein RPM1 [Trifolium repens]|nr:disease resistance protein RPM1 [Trifolium repens]
MCDTAISFARDHLLPLARDHLLPLARKHLFPLALDHLLPILKEAVNMIRGVPNDEIAQMKHELETIEDAIHQADKMVDAEGEDLADGTREKIKQLIEASFRIQDVIDEYIIRDEQQLPDPGCVDGASDYVKTKILRLQIAHDIQNIKSRISEIKYTSSEMDHEGSSSSITNPNATALQNLRKAPFYMKEADVVGFEKPRDKLVDWLVKGETDLTVVSVVAMGGQGKTTLAKKVFDNIEVVKHFDCRVWITVSLSYNIEELLRGMLKDLSKQQKVNPPKMIHEMNKESLVNEVRNYLQEKRYVVVFDDVWNSPFWADIKFAMIDKQKGCRILITTRIMDVATSCRESCFVEIHELKGLDDEQSLKLFNKKAFYDLKEVCPHNLSDISSEIVKKCDGLPLAIVVAGGLLCKSRNTVEWYRFNQNIKTKLNKDSVINKILVLSYHDLSYNLKSCLLYFGIYPEDCKVNSKKLIRQWIAEGFVKEEEGMTLEEVAEGYLTELIHRNLVQVVSVSIDGRAKYCRVHDFVHAMILEKFKTLSFCKNINVDGQSTLTGITRRLSMTTNSDNLMESINSSHVRSLFCIGSNLSESFVRKILTKYKLLKVFVLKDDRRLEIPEDFGSLIYLKYLELDNVYQENNYVIPKSICMLQNLETLYLVNTYFYTIPKEICKLRKLRHLIGYKISLIELKDDIGGLTSLQTLRGVYLNNGEDDSDNRVIDLIQDLGKLTQLRELVLVSVKTRYMSALSSSINKMQLLEKLCIDSIGVIDMHLNSPPPMLRHLNLIGKLEKLPEWIPKLQNLVKLKLSYSRLNHDIMEPLKSMPNLLTLSLTDDAFQVERLHFQDGWFKNLKQLILEDLDDLNCILIDEGALPSLETLKLCDIPKLEMLPTAIQHLKKLKDLQTPSYMN